MNTLSDIVENSGDLAIVTAKSPPKVAPQPPLLKIATTLVTVIIPVYNGSKYIQIAIDSILSQTYNNYEIIVIDDGSTDDTREKLKPYKGKIRYIYQENQGSAAARNVGINLAKGDLIAFLDADDYWSMPEKLAKQINYFNENPSLGCINTGWKIVDSAGKHIKSVQPWHKAPQLDLETWLKKKCVRTSAMVFRQEWLEKVGGFDEELRQSHDVDLILRLSLAGCETVWLKEETVCYRQHGENTTKNSLKQAKYIQAVLDKFFSRDDLPESISQQESKIRYHTLVWIAWYQYRAGNLDEMGKFLQKSLDFSPYLRVENISHWLNSFKRFSLERGQVFNSENLTNSAQWQELISLMLKFGNLLKQDPQGDTKNYSHKALKTSSDTVVKTQNSILAINKNLSSQQNNRSSNLTALKTKSQDLSIRNPISETTIPQLSDTKNNSKSTIKKYYELLEKSPHKLSFYYELCDVLVQQKMFDNAIIFYKIALKIKPDDFEINFRLASVLEKQGKLERAATYYSNAVQIDHNHSQCHQKLGEVLEKLGKIQDAIASYHHALENKEKLLIKQNNLEAVKEIYHRALEIQSGDSHSTTLATRFNSRVLFALHNSFPYSHTGYSTRSHSIITALANHGIEIVAATRLGYPWCEKNHQEKPKVKQDEIDNIKYVRCLNSSDPDQQISSSKYPEYIETYANELIKLAKNHQASIIHSSSNHVNGLAAAQAAHKIGISSIYEVRGLWYLSRAAVDPNYENSNAYHLDKEREFKAVNAADAVVTLSEALREEIISWGIKSDKVTVVPNSVNLAKFKPLDCDRNLKQELGLEGRFVVGFIGSITIYEGLDLLIKAVANLVNQGLQISLVVVGDGSELEKLQAIAASTSASEQIIFTGRVPFAEVNRYYSICDVCPLPRKSYEVCRLVPPLKPLEIMAMSKPVIVSNLPALMEIVEDGKNGLVCQADDIESLQQALISLYSDVEQRENLGKAGRDWVEMHRSWNQVSETYLQLYKTLPKGET